MTSENKRTSSDANTAEPILPSKMEAMGLASRIGLSIVKIAVAIIAITVGGPMAVRMHTEAVNQGVVGRRRNRRSTVMR